MSALFLDVRTVKAQIATLRHFHPEMDSDTQLLEDSLEGSTDFQEVIARIVRFERDADAFAGAIKAQEESLAERRARYVTQQRNYRAMIHALMDAAGQTILRLPEATVSVANDRAGCIVTSIDALPDQFVKTERSPKKADILASLLSGERVPGAELKNSGTHLSIRI